METTDAAARVLPAPDAEAAGLNVDALVRLRESIQHDIDRGLHFGANVLIARGGVVGFHEAIGSADPDSRPAALDDLFLLMSASKAFTATAVLRLVDHGLLELDTRIADVMPEYAARGKARVTVRHLLTHTGGTYFNHDMASLLTFKDAGDLSAAARFLSELPIAHRPGARVIYSPFEAFTILGEMLCRLDERGRPFRQILADDVFEPLGMADTSFGAPLDHPRRVPVRIPNPTAGAAQSAEVMEGFNVFADEAYEFPAGGAFSTTSDVFTFAETLRVGGTVGETRLLSRSLLEFAQRNHTGDAINEFWDFNREAADLDDFPGNFSLLGGYVRGSGYHLTPLGLTASPRAFGAVGSGTTMWMVDPDRELTVVFLSAGLVEGLRHFRRLQRISDLSLAAVE